MRIIKVLLLGLTLFGLVTAATAQDTKAYKDGNVIQLSYIKTKPGKFDEYMKYLAGDYKKLMEANIKAGLVVRYGVYTARPRTQHDHNVILAVTYPNYAALDRTEEADAIATKLIGPADARSKAGVDRGVMREFVGSELIREIVLK